MGRMAWAGCLVGFALALGACRGCDEPPAKKRPPVSKAAPSTRAQAAPAPAKKVAAPAPDPFKPPPKRQKDEKPTRAMCDAACQHGMALTVATLTPYAKKTFVSEIAKVTGDWCPANCMNKGTKASVGCVMAAQSTEQLASCPH